MAYTPRSEQPRIQINHLTGAGGKLAEIKTERNNNHRVEEVEYKKIEFLLYCIHNS